MEPLKGVQMGPSPVQIHNAITSLVLLYAPILDQQQRLIDLLTAQNRELAAQLAALRKSAVASMQPPEANP